MHVETILQELIAIPSLNPEDSDDLSLINERRVADYIKTKLITLGFKVEELSENPERPNLVGRLGNLEAPPALMIEAHMDTVGVENMTIDPFIAKIRDGRIYGRGACDDKGPLASALCAFTPELCEHIAQSDTQVLFVCSIAEEKAALGASYLAEQGIHANGALILEPTGLIPVIAHKGYIWFQIEIRGISGHASNPDSGKNAIEGMAEIIQCIKELHAEEQAALHDPYLGKPSYNFGLIKGGQATNIIADRCILNVDRRTLPGENVEHILQKIKRRLRELVDKGAVLSFDIMHNQSHPPVATPENARIVQCLLASCEPVIGKVKPYGTGWFSDAGPFSGVCDQVVVFGPGSIAQAHTRDEFIEIEQLKKGQQIITNFIQKAFCSSF